MVLNGDLGAVIPQGNEHGRRRWYVEEWRRFCVVVQNTVSADAHALAFCLLRSKRMSCEFSIGPLNRCHAMHLV